MNEQPSKTSKVCTVVRRPVELPGELWGITTYFNPAAFSLKLDHLRVFSANVRRQGLKLLLVELAFGENPHAVPGDWADRIIRVRSDSILWQKERLLNIALEQLPETCDKVAWVDADILFGNDKWVDESSRLLEEYVAVQPYSTARWLAPSVHQPFCGTESDETEFEMRGIAYAQVQEKVKPSSESLTELAGHPGFAWTARRSVVVRHGFYDRFIVGSGDGVMCLAMYGYHEFPCVRDLLDRMCSEPQIADVLNWSTSFYADVQGSVFYVEGPVLHLWHGRKADRRYLERHRILRDANFDPHADICVDSNGCWQWNSAKPELHRRLRDYFEGREEGPRASKIQISSRQVKDSAEFNLDSCAASM